MVELKKTKGAVLDRSFTERVKTVGGSGSILFVMVFYGKAYILQWTLSDD